MRKITTILMVFILAAASIFADVNGAKTFWAKECERIEVRYSGIYAGCPEAVIQYYVLKDKAASLEQSIKNVESAIEVNEIDFQRIKEAKERGSKGWEEHFDYFQKLIDRNVEVDNFYKSELSKVNNEFQTIKNEVTAYFEHQLDRAYIDILKEDIKAELDYLTAI